MMYAAILRTVRTEYGKRIRKSYEKGELDISRWDFLVYEPRPDGISNTLTTVSILVDDEEKSNNSRTTSKSR